MATTQELGLTALQKEISHQLDQLLQNQRVPQETREAILNSFEMLYEYIPYAIRQGKNPTDGMILADFMATKGMKMSKHLGNNSINCGIALVELFKSFNTAAKISYAPTAAVLAWGLAVLDLIEVGNSCEFAQDAYYQLFLKDSSHAVHRSQTAAGNLGKKP